MLVLHLVAFIVSIVAMVVAILLTVRGSRRSLWALAAILNGFNAVAQGLWLMFRS